MMYGAKNGSIVIDGTNMHYISFGKGHKNLVMIPGLGDGLKTVKGMAATFAVMYRKFAKDYKVYVFSRKNHMEQGYSTRDMAFDLSEAMKRLGIHKADILGVSQGGMIAQYLAIDNPDMIEKLVLAVTLSRQNETIQNAVGAWIEMAKKNDYAGIIIDTAEKSYSEKRLKKYRLLYPILSRIGKPENFDRFLIQANACLTHDTYDELDKINCKTLVIGGDSDMIAGKDTSRETAEGINGSKLIIYKGLGHMAYEEAKDFNKNVLYFLNGE